MKTSFCVLIGALLAQVGIPALGCGQVSPVEISRPGVATEIRGYGYGFEAGERRATLRWVTDRSIASTAAIDGNGDFVATVKVPAQPGMHRLIVSLGDNDPAPVEVTVPVALPWYARSMEVPVPVVVSAAIGSAAILALFLAYSLYWRTRRQRTLAQS